MGRLGRLFDLLSDGEWHRPEDIAPVLGVTRETVQDVVSSLSKYGLLSSQRSDGSIRLDRDLCLLFKQT